MDNPRAFEEDSYFCKLRGNDPMIHGNRGNNDTAFNGCPEHLPWCLNIAPNPNSMVTSFDNVGSALINVFVTITLEGWANIHYKLRDAGSPLYWLYFYLLTFIVGFFAANLCLAIIESVYSAKMASQQKKAASSECDSLTPEQEARGEKPCGKCSKCKLKQAQRDTDRSWKRQRTAKVMLMHTPAATPGTTPVPPAMTFDAVSGPSTGQSTGSTTPLTSNKGPNQDSSHRRILNAVPSAASDDMPDPEVQEKAKSDGVYIQNGKPLKPLESSLAAQDGDLNNEVNETSPRNSENEENRNTNDDMSGGLTSSQSLQSRTTSTTTTPRGHHRRKSKKKMKFQQPLGSGVHVYMHRFRTNTVPKSKHNLNMSMVQQIEMGSTSVPVTADVLRTMQSVKSLSGLSNDDESGNGHRSDGNGYRSDRTDTGGHNLHLDKYGKQLSISREFVPPNPMKMVSNASSQDQEEEPINPVVMAMGMSSSERSNVPLEMDNMNSLNSPTATSPKSTSSPTAKSPKSMSSSKTRNRGLTATAEERRLQYQASRHHGKANESMSISISTQKKQRKIENLKVDYKAMGNKENFVTTLARMSAHVGAQRREEIRKDWNEQQGIAQKDEEDGAAQWKASLVDDITFGDVPAQDAEMSEQERAEQVGNCKMLKMFENV